MANWRFGLDMYMSSYMRAIVAPTCLKDGYTLARESIFFRLISYGADEKCFDNAEQFAKIASLPVKQCRIVWDICVEKEILVKTYEGYSAYQWLKTNGLLVNSKPKMCKVNEEIKCNEEERTLTPPLPDNNQSEEADNSKEEAETQRVIVHSNPIILQKKQVRRNVFLTDVELEKIKQSFPEEQVTLMLDHLSEWKTQKGKDNDMNYSDSEAIWRWVIRWYDTIYNKNKNKNISSEEISTFPSWVTGN